MSVDTVWANRYFGITLTWINLIALLSILAYHSYRLCYLQRDRKGSELRLLKFISFRDLSFVVIISSILPSLQQAITYTPQQHLSNEICSFTAIFGMVCLAFSKFALHLFVSMRSQVATAPATGTTIWYKVGLLMTLSDLLWIIYAASGIPIITAEQSADGELCEFTDAPMFLFIWFGMNDFVIGMYCLLAFILPLRKYVWLERQQTQIDSMRSIDIQTHNKQNTDLQSITTRIMLYSSIALCSTMAFTVIAMVVHESGGVLFEIDSSINALCVTLQFVTESDRIMSCIKCPTISDIEATGVSTPRTQPQLDVVIHPAPPSNKPTLTVNKSLSVSIIAN